MDATLNAPALTDTVGHPRGRPRTTRSPAERAVVGTGIAALHVPPLWALAVGAVSSADVVAFAVLYALSGLCMGVGLHRYFAHRAFSTSRAMQLVLALGSCTILTDPIGFAGKHRLHHRHSDTPRDVHSPRSGLWFCWLGSLVDEGYTRAEVRAMVPDLCRYPELRWLERGLWLPAAALALATYLAGGWSMLAFAFFGSRVAGLHAVSAVNYFGHRFGPRPFETRDDSHNSPLLGVLTLGEGWHNNHHRFPGSARSGLGATQPDACYWAIRALEALGLVWNVRRPTPAAVARARRTRATTRS